MPSRTLRCPWLAAVIALSSLGPAARVGAFELFSSFGPSDSFLLSDTYTIAGPNHGSATPNETAFAFSPRLSGRADQVAVAIEQHPGPGFDILAFVATDSSGTPGTILTTGITPIPAISISRSRIVDIELTSPSTLDAGTTYWLGLATFGSADFGWHFNNLGLVTSVSYRNGMGGTWQVERDQPTPAARVSTIPEPATVSWWLVVVHLMIRRTTHRSN